ncbi:MAG: OmpA family protein [Betaproteobacteria bacterium]
MATFARLLLSALALSLAACSTNPKLATPKMEQVGALKVHPGLLGKPVPPELQQADEASRKVTRVEAAGENQTEGTPAKDTAGGKNGDASQLDLRSVYFDYRDATIKAEALPMLEAHARKLAQTPGVAVRIEGHADERGTENFNRRLGQQRAEAVKQWLVAKGVSAKQIKTVSLGRSKPKLTGHDEASWAMNRRAEIFYDN